MILLPRYARSFSLIPQLLGTGLNLKLLTKQEAAARRRCHPVHLMRLVDADSTAPQPVRIGARVYFVAEEVDAWLDRLVAEARGTDDPGESWPTQRRRRGRFDAGNADQVTE